MAVELTDTSANFVGTGGSSVYAAPIYANDDDQIGVYVDGVKKTLGDDYVLNGLGSPVGISITANFPNGSAVYVERATPIKQEVDTQNNETILEDVLDKSLDKLTMISQERAGETARAVLLPRGETGFVLPDVAVRRGNKVLGFNPITGLPEVQGTGLFKGDPGGNAMAIGLFLAAGTLLIPLGTDLVQTSGWGGVGKGAARYAYDPAVNPAYVAAHPRSSFRSANGRGFKIVEPIADVYMFGAAGDGVADDKPAVQEGLDVTQYLFAPPGKFRLGSTLTIDDGQVFYGAGTSAWEPYTGVGPYPNVFRTEFVVDGILAFNCTDRNSFFLGNFAIKSKTGVMSGFGTPPGFQAGARGIDITHTFQAQIDNVSFHGLEVAVDANQDTGLPAGSMLRAQSAQMPSITKWMAADCGTVFRFGNAATTDRVQPGNPGYVDPNPYTVRDPLIGECVIALHCGKMIDAHYCDGIRIEGARLFQAYSNSIYIRKTPFVTLNGVTCFENRADQVVIKDCVYVTMAGMNLTRAGCYANANPGFPAFTALTIDGCEHVSFEGTITQPGGYPIKVNNSRNVSLVGSIFQAFWTNGNPTGASGSVDIRNSPGVSGSLTESGSSNWIGLWCDEISAPTCNLAYTSDGPQGTVRAYTGPGSTTFVIRNDVAQDLGPGGTSAVFATLRLRIPAGKSLISRSCQMTSKAILRSGSIYWNDGLVNDADGGTVEYSQKGLATNGGATPGFFALPLTYFNGTGGVLTIPAGHETRLSFAVA